jgi:hypothetical protein
MVISCGSRFRSGTRPNIPYYKTLAVTYVRLTDGANAAASALNAKRTRGRYSQRVKCDARALTQSRVRRTPLPNRKVLCSHSMGDVRTCSQCATVKNMVKMEISSEVASIRKAQEPLQQAKPTPTVPAKDLGPITTVVMAKTEPVPPGPSIASEKRRNNLDAHTTTENGPSRPPEPASLPPSASPAPEVNPTAPVPGSISWEEIISPPPATQAVPQKEMKQGRRLDERLEGALQKSRETSEALSQEEVERREFMRDYSLLYGQQFKRPLAMTALGVSEEDLLLWALFQHYARRGARANHVQAKASSMRYDPMQPGTTPERVREG